MLLGAYFKTKFQLKRFLSFPVYTNLRILLSSLFILSLQSCCWFKECEDPQPSNLLPEFNVNPQTIPLSVNFLGEVSGIAASETIPHHLWLHEDSDSPAEIYLLEKNGQYKGKISLPFPNRDWEDITQGEGPEPNKSYLYISETGDNQLSYSEYYIYRFLEPTSIEQGVDTFEKITFKYPDGKPNDAETLLIEPITKDLYIITKYHLNVRVYRLPYPQNTSEINTAEFMGSIPYYLITSGDVSNKGDELLLKAHDAIYYWKIKTGENLFQTLSRNHDLRAPYTMEPQGEAICWNTDASGYFTISEQSLAPLYYYSKK